MARVATDHVDTGNFGWHNGTVRIVLVAGGNSSAGTIRKKKAISLASHWGLLTY